MVACSAFVLNNFKKKRVWKIFKGLLLTLMHYAPRTQIRRISCYTKLLIVLEGFCKDLVSVRTSKDIRSKKNVIRSNGSGYPFGKEMSSLPTTRAIRLRKIVIRLNGSGYPFKSISRARSRLLGAFISHISPWSQPFPLSRNIFHAFFVISNQSKAMVIRHTLSHRSAI